MPLVNVVLSGEVNRVSGELGRMRELALNPVGVLLAFERRVAQLGQLAARMGTGRRIGDLLDAEQKALTVIPASRPSAPRAVTTVTPEAKRPRTARKLSGSRDMEDEDRGGGRRAEGETHGGPRLGEVWKCGWCGMGGVEYSGGELLCKVGRLGLMALGLLRVMLLSLVWVLQLDGMLTVGSFGYCTAINVRVPHQGGVVILHGVIEIDCWFMSRVIACYVFSTFPVYSNTVLHHCLR